MPLRVRDCRTRARAAKVPGHASPAWRGLPRWARLRMVQAAMPELVAGDKHIIMIWLAGGVSQLETWDPKPKTNTGGPFRAIPTSVPGMHICELLPHTAQQMHHLAIVRSVNTKENDHGKGAYCMTTGRKQEPVADYPHLGAVGAKLLAPEDSPLPGHIHVAAGGSGGSGERRGLSGPALCQHHPGRRQSAAQHGAARGDHAGDRRQSPACVPREGERSLCRAPSLGRERCVSVVVRSGAAADGAARRVRREQGVCSDHRACTARTSSASTACWPGG